MHERGEKDFFYTMMDFETVIPVWKCNYKMLPHYGEWRQGMCSVFFPRPELSSNRDRGFKINKTSGS